LKSIIKHSSQISSKHEIGNKAKSLLKLQKSQLKVPNFYVIPYEELIAENTIKQLPLELKNWQTSFQINDEKLWSVRSSANVEDGVEKSYAGLFRTKINIKTSRLIEAILYVYEGFEQVSKNYKQKIEIKFGIIIQEMLSPDISGVIFSKNPMNNADKRITINIIPGLGEALVSGKYISANLFLNKKKIETNALEKTYEGLQYKNASLTKITQTNDFLIQSIKQHKGEIRKTVDKLCKQENKALDFEFCIVDNRLYWLQMRPMTAISDTIPDAVWDNSNIGENYPDLTSPLSASFVQHTYKIGYNQMLTFVGMSQKGRKQNEFELSNIVGALDGRMYYRITSWQRLLYQIPLGKKFSQILPTLMGMEKADFKPPKHKTTILSYPVIAFNLIKSFLFFSYYKKSFEKANYEAINELTESYFLGKSQQQLIDEIYELERKLIKKWIAPLINGLFAMLFYSAVKKFATKTGVSEDYPNFVNDILFSQGDVISVKIVRNFQKILDTIQQNEAIKSIFEQENNKAIFEQLENQFPTLSRMIKNYIEQFGERCDSAELKMETLNYKDNPLLFIDTIKKNLVSYISIERKQIDFDYKQVIKQKISPLNPNKYILLWLIQQSIKRMRDRENYRFMRTQTFAIMRFIFREMAIYLYKENLIFDKNDIFYLKLDELMDVSMPDKYRALIEKRKKNYAEYKKLKKENRYLQFGDKFVPYEPDDTNNSNTDFKGLGCSSGVVKGKVVIVDNPNIKPELIEGNILVAKYFEPGWINLFAKAGGLISERGSLLSHTAILCREMGLPSIVGAKKIATKLKTGNKVKMNGATGKIQRTSD